MVRRKDPSDGDSSTKISYLAKSIDTLQLTYWKKKIIKLGKKNKITYYKMSFQNHQFLHRTITMYANQYYDKPL